MKRALDYVDEHLDSDFELGGGEPGRRVLNVPFPPAVHRDLRVVVASLCPACSYEEGFAPACLQAWAKRMFSKRR